MGKSAFVVMPYDKKFDRLYSMVIEVALKSKGYTPIGDSYRQDRTGEGGVVMNNVIEKVGKAEEICKTLLDIDPESDMNSYSAFRLFKQTDRYELAYEALENCIRLDSDDEDYYFFMAGLIFDENLARISPDSPVQHIDDSEAKKYAIPFALAGYSVSGTPAAADRLRDFLIRNNCNDVLEKLANGDLDELNEEYDASMVEYCRHKQITPLFAEKQS